MVGRGPDAGEDRLGLAEAAVVGHPDDPVVVVGRQVGVEQPVGRRRRDAARARAARSRRPRRPGTVRRAFRPGRHCRRRRGARRPVSRSPTSAEPSGRNAMPHGTARPVITSPAICGFGAAGSVGVGVGVSVGVGVGGGASCSPSCSARPRAPVTAGLLVAAARRQRGERGAGAAAQQHPPGRAHPSTWQVERRLRAMGMEELDPIETASLDELRSLQTERLRATIQHTYDNVAHYRRGLGRRGRAPRRRPRAGRPREAAVHDQGRPARQLPVRDVRGAARAGWCACTRPAVRRASRPSSATPPRTSTCGRP